MKFRARIPGKNAVIVFTFESLLKNKFSNRKILWPWLLAGNIPDRFTGITDVEGIEIYENDRVTTPKNNKDGTPNGNIYKTVKWICKNSARNGFNITKNNLWKIVERKK